FSISLRWPTFRRPVASRIDHDVIGKSVEFLSHRSSRRFRRVQRSFGFPIGINTQRFQQLHLLIDDMDALRGYDFGVKKPAHGFLQKVPLPSDTNGGPGKVGEERGFQKSLKIDGAVVTVGVQCPNELRDLLRAADSRAIRSE